MTTEDDYINLIDEILKDAFEKEDDIAKCKAVFTIYLSGLSLKDSNMFGLIKLLLTAIRSCGSMLNVDVYDTCKKYNNELSEHKLEANAVGSISKCNFLGEKIDFDSNDSFANASDKKYNNRIMANVRDYDKTYNKGYTVQSNMHKAIEAKVLKEYKQSDLFKNQVTDKINRLAKRGISMSTESAQDAILNSPAVKNYLNKKVKDEYNKWYVEKYPSTLERYKQNQERLASSRYGNENFD